MRHPPRAYTLHHGTVREPPGEALPGHRHDTRHATLFLVLLVSALGMASGTADLIGIPWGTPLANVRDRFELVPSGSDSLFTRYEVDLPPVDGADVAECILEFRDAKFVGLAVYTRGRKDTHRLFAYLERLFGPGRSEEVRSYQWFNASTHLFYDEDSDGNGYVYCYSRTLLRDLDPDRPRKQR